MTAITVRNRNIERHSVELLTLVTQKETPGRGLIFTVWFTEFHLGHTLHP